MSKRKVGGMLSALLLAGATTALAHGSGVTSAPQCEIRLHEIPGAMRVESIVHGEPGSSGVYDFTMTRSGSGGASDVSQSGAYTIADNGQATLSVSEFNQGRHDQLEALLSIDTQDGRVECQEHS